jgi:excinuclease ABC subunit A
MIRIVKAKVHNLKDLSVSIPRKTLTVITGVSGSGKSSLAFDTIHAEGQRRYMESLSSYARQFLQQMEKPDVESIEGLSPTIAIQQKSTSRNPRSTVGTITELYDYFRLLFAAIGTPHCPQCRQVVESSSPKITVAGLLKYPDKTRFTLLAPIVRGRKGEYNKVFDELRKEGLARVRIDGNIWSLDDEIPELDRNKKHNIEVAVDRVKLSKENRDAITARLTEAVELCFKLADGQLTVVIAPPEGDSVEKHFSENLHCPACDISLPEIKPRLFSFNAPFGSCAACSGLGLQLIVEPELVIPDLELSINQGAIASENFVESTFSRQWMQGLAELYDFSLDAPFKDLPEKVKEVILYGSGNKVLNIHYHGKTMKGSLTRAFEGVIPTIARRHRETRSDGARRFYERFMRTHACPDCEGRRLNNVALSVKIKDENIHQMSQHSVGELVEFFNDLKLTEREAFICKKVLEQIRNRLKFLKDVGLDYLDLSRAAHTLSGGEAQRIRLATQIGSALVGITYVLDEPSIGLHPRDNRRLIDTLKHLRDIGNTVLVVEHDREIMQQADNIIDLGPGAGAEGGFLVVDGSPAVVMAEPNSQTGKFLSGSAFIPVPDSRREGNGRHLTLKGAALNNLKNIDVKIPLGNFVVVTGVSGSGKSSLVTDTLFPLLNNIINRSHLEVGKHTKLEGLDFIDKVVNIDQNPIGRTPRSNPATYTGIFTPIRELFSQTVEAKARGYAPGRFSFNVKGGRCDTCEGSGQIQIEMHFLPDVFVTCEQCRGSRFNDETLKVKFKGLNIAEVLQMSVAEALPFFDAFTAIRRRLQTLKDVGLGYITLGQASTTLSGGEAQRIKLATELAKVATGSTFYLLDEPTTGLHFQDVECLLGVLNRLVEKGNTVLVVEHNLDVIKCADYIIDLGPEGGEKGGSVVATGTPEEVARHKKSLTAAFIAEELARKKSAPATKKGMASGNKNKTAKTPQATKTTKTTKTAPKGPHRSKK